MERVIYIDYSLSQDGNDFFLYDILKHNEEKIIGESIYKYSVGYVRWKRGVICY